ncbi:neutral protease 2 [Arthroderma uncinatum]|uniref:neutral protease 2 n=1 Tax=Arthroderma uncinatum TaxID=74035 RepID=UPI00144ADBD1|nr:neutral protease 2 [Arthroderma uncinatum]KAF3491129.1 neutral protease 2 [Arthroderma uncinatum]
MQILAAFAALSSLAAPVVGFSIPRGVPTSDSMIDVKLSATGNSMVKATITNNGDRALNLLRFHTIMDSNPTRKVNIYQKGGAEVQFTGMMPRYLHTDLKPSYFMSLPAKGSVEHSFDIAATHDLSRGGEYILKASGVVPVAEENGTNITGAANYHSNELRMNIDGKKAASVERAMGIVKRSGPLTRLGKRTSVDMQSCSNQEELQALTNALQASAQLSSMAAQAVSQNQDKYMEYFKDPQYTNTVQSRFQAVAQESSSTSGGGTTYHCTDLMNGCEEGVLAYTLPSQNEVFNCPIYYSMLPPLSQECHAQDQATTTLHELTHNPAVQEPFCEDNGYGYERATALSAEKAVQNADSYALFANAIYVGC